MFSSSMFIMMVLASVLNGSEGFAATKTAKSGGFGAKKVDPMAPHRLDNSLETMKLVEFINNAGGKCNEKAKIASVKNAMRGLVCTKDIKKGETICSLPSSIALALSDPNAEDVDVVEAAGNYLDWYLNNAERMEYFEPYLSSLPTDGGDEFSPTPDYFSMEEIAELEFPKMIEKTMSRIEKISEVAKAKGVSEEDLRYYAWLTSSRSFNIRLSIEDEGAKAKSVRVLVPFFDMINHSPSSNAEFDILDPELDDSTFVIRAKRNIREGQEVTIGYGSGGFSSLDLFGEYGFVDPLDKMESDEKNVKKGPLQRKPVTPDERMMAKEEERMKGNWDGWQTTLEDDVKEFIDCEPGSTRARILEFRVKLKRAGGWEGAGE